MLVCPLATDLRDPPFPALLPSALPVFNRLHVTFTREDKIPPGSGHTRELLAGKDCEQSNVKQAADGRACLLFLETFSAFS